MAPGRAWEMTLRAAAAPRRRPGPPGQRAPTRRSAPAETVHDHVDVLVVGAGTAGLAAAQQLSRDGLRVMLAEEDVVLGGGSLLDPRWSAWREATCRALAADASVRCLTRTAVIGAYGHGVYAALETLAPAESGRARRPARTAADRTRSRDGACDRRDRAPDRFSGQRRSGGDARRRRAQVFATLRRGGRPPAGVLPELGRSLRDASRRWPRPASSAAPSSTFAPPVRRPSARARWASRSSPAQWSKRCMAARV